MIKVTLPRRSLQRTCSFYHGRTSEISIDLTWIVARRIDGGQVGKVGSLSKFWV